MIEPPKPQKEINPWTWTISPTQLGLWMDCPNLWYLGYLCGVREPKNRHMIRGSAYHKAMEMLWTFDPKALSGEKEIEHTDEELDKNLDSFVLEGEDDVMRRFREYGLKMFDAYWHKYREDVTHDLEEFDLLYPESKRAFTHYLNTVTLEVGRTLDKGKTINQALKWARPYKREQKLYSKDRTEVGIIDKVETQDDIVVLVDYKTSSMWGPNPALGYERQMGFYGYLYQNNFGILPDYWEVDFVLYGKSVRHEMTQKLVDRTMKEIDNMRHGLDAIVNKGKEPKKNPEYQWCRPNQNGTGGCWAGNVGICDRIPS